MQLLKRGVPPPKSMKKRGPRVLMTDDERQNIIALIKSGMSLTAIGKKLGRSPGTISWVNQKSKEVQKGFFSYDSKMFGL